MSKKIKVAVNGYGVIGRRVADAILLQEDMDLVGVSDISFELRVRSALNSKIALYASTKDALVKGKESGISLNGTLKDLIRSADIVVDCTPKRMGAENASFYSELNIKFILQGGEKHDVTGHSFVAESNYKETIGKPSARVVSCNTTSIVRTLTALKKTNSLISARGVLLRRSTDPWKSHQKGIINTLLPEDKIPSHQGPDAQTVDHDLDVVTMAVMVPETLGHLHYWTIQMSKPVQREELIDAFKSSSRIALINAADGLNAINAVKELMLDLGRPHGNMYEVAIWENLIETRGQEVFYAYMVDNQAIVIPETIDAIRALDGTVVNAEESIAMTNRSLGIKGS
ncbi:MAG: type II glyceraldehyde-3-phosphate dehydrogenase, partial [Bdellovibrionales bacterium]|nr:type II glyceraldehyde-3-phosphate dehydrogenase [Bdellovibrionales bacterium]